MLITQSKPMNDLDYDKIDRYIEGKMSTEELQDFEQKLKVDETLADAVTLQSDLLKGIELFGDQQLRENIQQAERNITNSESLREQPKPRRIVLFSIRNMAIAASFLVLIVAGFFLFRTTDQPGRLYANYFQMDLPALDNEIEDLSLLGMGIADRERRDQLKSGLELVQAEQYDEAVKSLREHLQAYPQDEVATYFLGLSLMQIKSFEEAIRVLAPIESNEVSEYNEDARWFQSLSWLQIKGGKDSAIPLLEQIAGEPGPHSSQAALLLKDLNVTE